MLLHSTIFCDLFLLALFLSDQKIVAQNKLARHRVALWSHVRAVVVIVDPPSLMKSLQGAGL